MVFHDDSGLFQKHLDQLARYCTTPGFRVRAKSGRRNKFICCSWWEGWRLINDIRSHVRSRVYTKLTVLILFLILLCIFLQLTYTVHIYKQSGALCALTKTKVSMVAGTCLYSFGSVLEQDILFCCKSK